MKNFTILLMDIMECNSVMTSWDAKFWRLLWRSISSWLVGFRALIVEIIKLIFVLCKRSLGSFRINVAAGFCPETQYINEHINLEAATAHLCFKVESILARFLAAVRAKSLFPSFHNATTYICKALPSSRPSNFEIVVYK